MGENLPANNASASNNYLLPVLLGFAWFFAITTVGLVVYLFVLKPDRSSSPAVNTTTAKLPFVSDTVHVISTTITYVFSNVMIQDIVPEGDGSSKFSIKGVDSNFVVRNIQYNKGTPLVISGSIVSSSAASLSDLAYKNVYVRAQYNPKDRTWKATYISAGRRPPTTVTPTVIPK